MVIVKILGKEDLNGRVIWLKKLIMYRGEPRGDRVVLERYDLTEIIENGTGRWDDHGTYIGFEQEEAITIFELMQEEL